MYGEEIPYKVITESDDSTRKRAYWDAAIGLQKVDGLIPSGYLVGLAEQNIEGSLSIDQVGVLLNSYYTSADAETPVNPFEREADLVSQRIVKLLDASPFIMSSIFIKEIHRELFHDIEGIEPFAGVYRSYDIMKEEPILFGRSVVYSYSRFIENTLNGFISEESSRMQSYLYPLTTEDIKKLAVFTSSLWHVHPFVEGNTRTTAVFIELCLRWLGYDVDDAVFAQHSEYFRNALVRASFFDNKNGVVQSTEYVEKFLSNLLSGAAHDLDSGELFVEALKNVNQNTNQNLQS